MKAMSKCIQRVAVDWIRYISAFIPRRLQYRLAKRQVRLSQILTIRRLEEFLLNIDPQTLSDYLDWKEFTAQVYGVQGRDRTDECVALTLTMFHDLAGKQYLEQHFNFDSVFNVKELIEDVRSAFLEMLSENEWMDEKTKNRARIKLNFNAENNYYDIVMTMELWLQKRAFLKLEKLNIRDTFDTSVVDVNAFYDGSQNHIAIMAGMLQSPFFNVSLPRIMNYGAIGVVAGHEITHGFDDSGASYDEVGNKNNWWDDQTYKNFEWKKQCFDDQYGSIFVGDLNVRAAARLASRSNDPFTVAGLEDFTQMQYFFMNYAFIWCGSTRRATLLNKLATDVHPPDMYRNVK
ncbi:peptidase family M13 [Necator americanus]|uniref:Peptidase family M13 n=1 Tax=Necator americanus TaxID=51031 RepID=W2U1M6_NECAM|nr:peptidase family M13 [Necator americanus]ETN87256.1 peptidase family M13 [Necator americanus]